MVDVEVVPTELKFEFNPSLGVALVSAALVESKELGLLLNAREPTAEVFSTAFSISATDDVMTDGVVGRKLLTMLLNI